MSEVSFDPGKRVVTSPKTDQSQPPYEVQKQKDGSIRIKTGKSTWSVTSLSGRYIARAIYSVEPGKQADLFQLALTSDGSGSVLHTVGPKDGLSSFARETFLNVALPVSLPGIEFKPVNLDPVAVGKPGHNEGVRLNFMLDEITSPSGVLAGGQLPDQPFKNAGIGNFRQALVPIRALRPV